MDHSGKVALVTGGSRGIGFAIAESLITTGAEVVITGREQSQLDAAASKLPAAKLHRVRADVRDASQAAQAITAAVDRFGGLDILINNAGVGRFANVAEMPPDDWQQVFDTNVTGVFHCCREAIPHLRRRG